jgi:predicted nucleic acid-binding protein
VGEYVLWELINAFSQPAHRLKVHAALDLIQGNSQWQVEAASQSLFEPGLLMHQSHRDKSWSLTDCISFIMMREHGTTRALTHDHHFEQAGFEALLRRDPP